MRSLLRGVVFGAPLLALLLGSCAVDRPLRQQPINHYLAEDSDLDNVRRILVLPFDSAPGVDGDVEMVRRTYVDELNKLRRFEILPLPHGAAEAKALNASVRKGRPSADVLVELCRAYQLDGVVVGTLTSWRPYQPPHMGLRVEMFSVHSGATVWAVDAMYDCSDQMSVTDLMHFYATEQEQDTSLHGWELNMLSPSRFAGYVSSRVVGTFVQ